MLCIIYIRETIEYCLFLKAEFSLPSPGPRECEGVRFGNTPSELQEDDNVAASQNPPPPPEMLEGSFLLLHKP